MSRYRKVIMGEYELPEINGTRFLIYPTIETRMELLELIKTSQMFEEHDVKNDEGKVVSSYRMRGKYLDFNNIAKTCARMVFEGCFTHNGDGKRLEKKGEEKDTTYEDILALLLESDIMALYLEILQALDIIDKKKASEMKAGVADAAKNQ